MPRGAGTFPSNQFYKHSIRTQYNSKDPYVDSCCNGCAVCLPKYQAVDLMRTILEHVYACISACMTEDAGTFSSKLCHLQDFFLFAIEIRWIVGEKFFFPIVCHNDSLSVVYKPIVLRVYHY
mmetsp:Transcript_11718/g.24797  ORF Transcript_11718/g.24797 Transcript_11718/m.24797 type:complete len:122 (+) Transcript_11718:731-1096(+)